MDRDIRNPFIITAVVMCSVTCLVVFNVNWTSDVLIRKYRGTKKKKKKSARDGEAPGKKYEVAACTGNLNDGDEVV
jgi:hypothetical protein